MKLAHWEIYKDSEGAYRWRFVAKNGLQMADSSEGYNGLSKVNRALDRFIFLTGADDTLPRMIVSG